MTEEMRLPNYENLINKSAHEMSVKFINYGNDWLEKDAIYWKERILKEVKEYIESMTIDSEKRKLLNILNMIAMAYDTIENRGCIYHIVPFEIIVKSEKKRINTICNRADCGKPLTIYNGIIREVEK